MESTRKYRATDGTCSGCQYWGGKRSLDLTQRFLTAVPRDKGTCFGKQKPLAKMAQDKMQCWTRWLLLNENNKSEVLRQLQETIEILKA